MDDPSGVSGSADTLKPTGTLASSVYQQLRTDIVKGRFEPGSKLRLQHLARQYSVGNGPLREALNRLSSNGLVVRDQGGFHNGIHPARGKPSDD